MGMAVVFLMRVVEVFEGRAGGEWREILVMEGEVDVEGGVGREVFCEGKKRG